MSDNSRFCGFRSMCVMFCECRNSNALAVKIEKKQHNKSLHLCCKLLWIYIRGVVHKSAEFLCTCIGRLIDSINYHCEYIIYTLVSSHQILTSLVHHVTSYYCLKVVKFWTLPNQQFGRKFKLPFETRFVKFDI